MTETTGCPTCSKQSLTETTGCPTCSKQSLTETTGCPTCSKQSLTETTGCPICSKQSLAETTGCPTSSKQSLRMLFIATSTLNWDITSIDIRLHFLQGDELERDVVIHSEKKRSEPSKI